MDDDINQAAGVDPQEMAERDTAKADAYQEWVDAEAAISKGFRLVEGQMRAHGFDEAANSAFNSAGHADVIQDEAESGASFYTRAATAWMRVAEDQTEEQKRADQADAEKLEGLGHRIDTTFAKPGE